MRKCLDCEIELSQCGNAKKRCDSCQKEYRKLCWRMREKDPARKEHNRQRHKKFRDSNPDKVKEYAKKYNDNYRKGINRQNYLAKKRELNKKYYHDNIETKLAQVLRNKLWKSVKDQNTNKENSALELVGCSKEELIEHIQSQFKRGMTWENWSLNGWHIDHIRPISSFNLADPAQQKECFHYSNLQPLWAIENLKKSDSWDESPQDDIVF
jgi:hypothetical protein